MERGDDLHGTMPDMKARMEQLNTLSGAAFDVEYLSQLADHHGMAISMAAPVLISGHHEDLYNLAQNIVVSQGQEIKTIDALLEGYGVKRPPGRADHADADRVDGELASLA